jgi:hypothetical protein
MEVDWVVSHFQSRPVQNGTLVWRLETGGRSLATGKIESLDLAAGSVGVVGRSRIVMPSLPKAVKATLVVELEAAGARNSWNVWIIPKVRTQPDGGKGLAATAGVFNLLAKRYPAIVRLDAPESSAAKVVVARSLIEPGVIEALEQGKSVVCLTLPGIGTLRPGVRLGWWQVTSQTGTAIAAHPAFGDFPHDGYLDQGWFRLVDRAEKLDPGHKFRDVEPLMVGIGREWGYSFGTMGYPLGFNLYAFQARAGRGKLLSTGLDVTAPHPEAAYLLDQFLRYAASERFAPSGTFDVALLREQIKAVRELNGWSETVKASEKTEWYTFLRTAPMYVVRQLGRPGSVAWKTRRWKADAGGTVTFRWIANLGWRSQPAGGKFTFFLRDEKLLDFDISLKSTEWKSPDGKSVLRYAVKSHDRDEDSSGIMELTVPAAMLPPGGEPVLLRVDGSGPESRRYFGLQESP